MFIHVYGLFVELGKMNNFKGNVKFWIKVLKIMKKLWMSNTLFFPQCIKNHSLENSYPCLIILNCLDEESQVTKKTLLGQTCND